MTPDSLHRSLAINPQGSYTVTAPAGSGKTELLSQRFLALLGIVEKPEQILAITFTRKAVAEMRERVLLALTEADRLSDVQIAQQAEHRTATLLLARKALDRDRVNGWYLLQNPARLRIFTFDAFSASIVRQLPLASRFGGAPVQTADPYDYYERAVQGVLEQTANGTAIAAAVNTLLLHLDCQVERLNALLCNTLAKRDQWRVVFSRFTANQDQNDSFAQLEGFFNSRIEALIAECHDILDPFSEQLCTLLNFSNDNLVAQSNGIAAPYLGKLPAMSATDLEAWRTIARFLIGSQGHFRQRVDKRHGFPPKSAKPKYSSNDFKALVASIEACTPLAGERLNELLVLPEVNDLTRNRRLIEALLQVMQHCMAHLELEFQSRQEVDFVATSVQALHALQEAGEVAVRLDYQVKHVLVDEFQDTSQVQYDLLHALCNDWGDLKEEGRSLFLVGDAMQSIYAFRNARVALFMRARRHGLAGIAMQPLTLNSNFRSYPAILNWVNHTFSNVFPAVDDLTSGASAFVESLSQRTEEADSAVHVFEYDISDKDRSDEAAHICEQILRLKESNPSESIAILVRSRKQAEVLYPHLRHANIAWQATEFELLSSQPVVNDLLALSEICINPSNIVSWYALLRSPLLGLQLQDLLLISQSRSASGLAAIEGALRLVQLSSDASTRLEHFVGQYHSFASDRERKPSHVAIRGLWLALGGELFYSDENSLHITHVFFSQLAEHSAQATKLAWNKLRAKMESLYAESVVKDDNAVQLMTMHKAKGLEFDTVILPSLDRSGRPDDTELLNWLDGISESGEASLLLGMYQPGSNGRPSSNSYIRGIKKNQSLQENARLMYVACTRAVKHLYLYRGYTPLKDGPKASSASSLAAVVWPHLPKPAIDISGYNATEMANFDNESRQVQQRLSLRAFDYFAKKSMPTELSDPERNAPGWDNTPAPEQCANLLERAIGTVVHRELQEWQLRGKTVVLSKGLESRRVSWLTQLEQLGFREPLVETIDNIEQIVKAVSEDEGNAWLFGPGLTDDAGELSMKVSTEQGVQSICIDRTFVDSAGQRWIIDYKVHLDMQASQRQLEQLAQSHKPQLLSYQAAFDSGCCLAIYYLLQQRLVVVQR